MGFRSQIFVTCLYAMCLFKDIIADEPVAQFPLEFSATITITAHLIEPETEYPPRTRNLVVHYDYIHKRARVDLDSGYEAEKVYIRRYDKKQEYMIRAPPINDCKRSYLGEIMPYPSIPTSKFIRVETVNGKECNYFLHEDYDTRIHIYMDSKTGAPHRLIQESTENEESIPLLTYDYSDVLLGAQNVDVFEIPSPYQHATCDRHVGGFPYQHIFHHFVRF